MLVRYTKAADGKPVKQAEVYTKEEHGLTNEMIDPDALFITRKLRSAGFEAYIVGGAVRDLLLGRKPKDFDVVTDAHPRAIKKVLPFSRIIGKRFRLVHVYFANNKIIEVATFRSNVEGDNNVFGTLEEDAKRRDFSFNALYYDPKDQHVIDQVDGLRDVRAKRLKNVIPLQAIFDEDPVRMIRAVKYASTSHFVIPGKIAAEIRNKAKLLHQVSPARLTEEFYKILFSGLSETILTTMEKVRVLEHFLPSLSTILKPKLFNSRAKTILAGLTLLDKEVKTGKDPDRSGALTFLIAPWLEAEGWNTRANTDNFEEIVQHLKDVFKPIVPSNQEIENGLRDLYRVWAVRTPKKRPPRGARRRRPSGGKAQTSPQHRPETRPM